MKKIWDFIKDKYKIFIPIVVVIVLLIVVGYFYKEYNYNNYKNKKDVGVYQYFGGLRHDYTAVFTYNIKDVIVDIRGKDEKIEYDSTPIYLPDEDKVIFPNAMSVVFPLREGSQYKIYKYSIYEYAGDDNIHYLTSGEYKNKYTYFFLFDGNDTYFFPYETSLKIGGTVYKKLSPMSYVSLVGGVTLIYYDKGSDTSEVIEVDNKKVEVFNDNLDLNISEKYFNSFSNKVLLFKTDFLNDITKMNIDK